MADSKPDLRARIRAARSRAMGAASSASQGADLLAVARSAGLLDPDGSPDSPGALAIAAYIAAPGEPDVAAIRLSAREEGGVVLLPIPRADRTLDWALDDGGHRPHGRYPIDVPTGAVIGSGAAALLDHGVRTLFVPALAVDRSGARLGQGGGYYDRLLAELARRADADDVRAGSGVDHPRGAGPLVVAVVRDEELLPAGSVPVQGHDQLMMAALTPTRFVRLGAG